MFKIGVTFLTLLVSVIGAVYGGQPESKNSLRFVSESSVELQPCSNRTPAVTSAYKHSQDSVVVEPAFRGQNSQCPNCNTNGKISQEYVVLSDSEVATCRPQGQQPPAFFPPPASPPMTATPAPLPVASNSGMPEGATIGLIVCGLSALGGVFIRKRKEDDADEKAEADKAEKEKKYRERAVKITAAPHVANV